MFKEPGDWYGVNSISQVLASIFESKSLNCELNLHKEVSEVFQTLNVITFQEGRIIMDRIT
jgi:hypothetical protein